MDIPKPFFAHLQELRTLVIKCGVAFTVLLGLCYSISHTLFAYLAAPLTHLFHQDTHRFIYTHPTEAFLTYVKVAAFFSFMLLFPYILLQVWKFISPGLFSREKKVFRGLMLLVPFFFISGLCFAYYGVMPQAFSFFLSFETVIDHTPLQLETKIGEYLSFVMRFLFAFGISFELPVILGGLAYCRLITAKQLCQNWRYGLVGVTIISAIITPPDALSMIMLSIPLLVLYSLGIVICYLIEKNYA